MIKALCQNQEAWTSPVDRRMGFIQAQRRDPGGDSRFTAFLMDAQRAARDVTGLTGTTPGQLAAAMEELEGNIHEHSVAIESGRLAFRAARDRFEFVVSDRGIGILRSLQRSPIYASLLDHGRALEEALKDGTSRFGNDGGRGYGFRPIFIGLANLAGSLRFRSGDHALLMDGTGPNLTTARLAQKANLDGFFASITILLE
jgi:anti-sigma regulatory factor (Ser/Thr protein kinase)